MKKLTYAIIAAAVAVAVAIPLATTTGCTPNESTILAAANTAGNLGLSAWFVIDEPDAKVKAVLKDVVTMVGDSTSKVGAGESYVDALTKPIQDFVAGRDGLTPAQKNLINAGAAVILGTLDTFIGSNPDIQGNVKLVSNVVAAFCKGCLTAIERSEDSAEAKALKKAHEAVLMRYDAEAKAFAVPAAK